MHACVAPLILPGAGPLVPAFCYSPLEGFALPSVLTNGAPLFREYRIYDFWFRTIGLTLSRYTHVDHACNTIYFIIIEVDTSIMNARFYAQTFQHRESIYKYDELSTRNVIEGTNVYIDKLAKSLFVSRLNSILFKLI